MKNRLLAMVVALPLSLVFNSPSVWAKNQANGAPRWTLDQVSAAVTGAFAIGHRAYGETALGDPGDPSENSTAAVRKAFREGVMVVEVDVVMTADDVVIALHDDYLPDLTCVNTLTYQQVKQALGKVASLRQILQVSRTYSVVANRDRPSGQVLVEIKSPSPHCVRDMEQEAAVLPALVDAVVDIIHFTRMTQQVAIQSFSPEIVSLAAQRAPYIPGALLLNALQLVPQAVIEEQGLCVRPLDNKTSFGLAWGDIGAPLAGTCPSADDPAWYSKVLALYRYPSYFVAPGVLSFPNYVRVLLASQSRIAAIDRLVFGFPGVDPADLVESLHDIGIGVFAWTVDDANEWLALSAIEVDGIITNAVSLGLDLGG